MSEVHYTDCERVLVHKALGGIPLGFGCTCVQRTLEREREEDRAAIRELTAWMWATFVSTETEKEWRRGIMKQHAVAIARASA